MSSAARASACLRFMSKCVSSVSRICLPIVRTGLSEVIGSWKIIAISRPRVLRRARSFCVSKSRPWKTARPERTRPFQARRPRIASEVTLLPQPASPTMPSVSPAEISKEIPLTAWTTPLRVVNSTRRSCTSRREALPVTKLRIECFAQAVADQVEAQHEEDDREPRDDREERSSLQVVVHVGQHRPPFRRRRVLRTEPEEPETGDVDDRGCHRERPLHDQRRDRVGQDVREEDHAPANADGPRREHEVVLLLREDGTA